MVAGLDWKDSPANEKTPLVHQAIDSLGSRLDVLDSAIAKLREVLSCVMDEGPRPATDQCCAADPKAQCRKCSVSSGIFAHRDRVESLICSINDVLDRIEL
jgi:hypothetical protein